MISGAKGSEATTAQGAMVPSSGPSGTRQVAEKLPFPTKVAAT